MEPCSNGSLPLGSVHYLTPLWVRWALKPREHSRCPDCLFHPSDWERSRVLLKHISLLYRSSRFKPSSHPWGITDQMIKSKYRMVTVLKNYFLGGWSRYCTSNSKCGEGCEQLAAVWMRTCWGVDTTERWGGKSNNSFYNSSTSSELDFTLH